MKRTVTALLFTLVVAVVTGCNGPVDPNVAEGGIGGSGISMGRVAQVGSVYVNGIQYNTDNTVFVINGSEINQGLSDIAVGMVVCVTGSKDAGSATGVADRIAYDSLLIGAVDSVFDPATNHIGVMGQAVHINADTVLEDNLNDPAFTIDQVAAGTIVEVSGYPSSPGEILATRVELKAATGTYMVTGTVDTVANNSLTIGGLNIDTSAAMQEIPAEGSYVRVQGSIPPSQGDFVAESIVPVSANTLASDGEPFSIEGVINTGLDASTHLFVVNGLTIDASYTPYGEDEMSLAAGRIVEVEGIMNGSELLAVSIEVEASKTSRGEAGSILEDGAVDIDAKTITLLDNVIHITNSTIFESDLHGESTFSLSELEPGDFLTAKVVDNNGELTATKLELDYTPSSYDATLEGSPNNLGNHRIEILGVEIDTSGVSGYTYSHDRVEVRGYYDSNNQILTATRIEKEDD